MSKYSKSTQTDVEKEMRAYKQGKVKSREQAIAIGLSKAREAGKKVPPKTTDSKKTKKIQSARTLSSRRTNRQQMPSRRAA